MKTSVNGLSHLVCGGGFAPPVPFYISLGLRQGLGEQPQKFFEGPSEGHDRRHSHKPHAFEVLLTWVRATANQAAKPRKFSRLFRKFPSRI